MADVIDCDGSLMQRGRILTGRKHAIGWMFLVRDVRLRGKKTWRERVAEDKKKVLWHDGVKRRKEIAEQSMETTDVKSWIIIT